MEEEAAAFDPATPPPEEDDQAGDVDAYGAGPAAQADLFDNATTSMEAAEASRYEDSATLLGSEVQDDGQLPTAGAFDALVALAEALNQTGDATINDGEGDGLSTRTGTSTVVHGSGKLSTVSEVHEEEYEKSTGRRAGMVLPRYIAWNLRPLMFADLGSCGLKRSGLDANNIFHPFRDEADYALAHWFMKYDLSKAAVDNYLTDPRMAGVAIKASFKNADEWRILLDSIPIGIPYEQWTVESFKIK